MLWPGWRFFRWGGGGSVYGTSLLLLQDSVDHLLHHFCDGDSAQSATSIVITEFEAKKEHNTVVVKVLQAWGSVLLKFGAGLASSEASQTSAKHRTCQSRLVKEHKASQIPKRAKGKQVDKA